MRRVGVLAALVGVIALVLAAPAGASPRARFGIQDDGWLLYAGPSLDARLATLDELGVRLVRFTLRWDMVARSKPVHPLDPDDPSYDWAPFDAVIDGLHDHDIATLVTIWGAPRWSNGGHGPNWLPQSGLGSFAYAASKRYPFVHLWTIWNEPNTRVAAVPVSPSLYVRRLLNPAYVLLHRASPKNVVAGGVTSPRATRSGMSPASFMAGMHAAHARLDAYAQNPYPGSPRDTPFHDSCSWCRSLTMARLGLIRSTVRRYFGARTPVWLTEYGVQTDPPDRIFGVPPAQQAAFVGQAALRVWEEPGVTMMIHFLVRDDPELGGWQSGLLTARGSAKPAYRAFALPFAEQSRRGSRVVLWGQVRPGSGRRPYAIQRWTGRRWVNLGGVRRTGSGGTFRVTVGVRPHTKLRLRPTQIDFTSPILVVT